MSPHGDRGYLTRRIAHRLRIARVAAGLTQADLAYAADVDRWTIGRVERLEQLPSRRTRRQLAAALGMSEDELFGVEGCAQPSTALLTTHTLCQKRETAA